MVQGEHETSSRASGDAATGDFPFQCRCAELTGTLRGVSPQTGNLAVCYCESCQTFPRVLGCADHVLDADGGTEIFQTSVRHLRIAQGADRLACLRITPRGPLRWYALCCSTPIANCAASSALPIFGLILPAGRSREARELGDRVLGPVRFRVQGQDALRDVSDLGARTGFGLPLMWRVARLFVRARLRGDSAHHPFFERSSGAPVATPRVVTAAERARTSRTKAGG